MHGSLRLGKVAGFPVAVHWSVGGVLLLIAWALADAVLPRAAPGHSAPTYWLTAIVGAVVMLCSLLAHELAHAVVARRAGVEVDGLTLWLFGGVATLRGEAPTPSADFKIAAVGPATSLVLAAVFGVTRVVADSLGRHDLIAGLVGWLAVVNLVLAVFNLVPGAPLDGGRVLRAVLWARSGDRDAATAQATRAGEVVAFALFTLGFLLFLAGAPVNGVWTVLVAWFIFTAARAERAATITQNLLQGVLVRDVMSSPADTIDPDLSVETFTEEQVLRGRHSTYPVIDRDGAVLGLMTLRQVRSLRPQSRATVSVREVLLPMAQVTTAAPSDPLIELLPRLDPESGYRALVLEAGRLIGIVTQEDVTRAVESRILVAPSR